MLDNSLEITIGFARACTVLDLIATVSFVGAWIWTGDARFGGLAALTLAFACSVGWFGFWLFGNEEWRRGKTDDRAA